MTEEDITKKRHQLLFGSSERFEIQGKIASVNADQSEITILRNNLPPALLKVEPQTKLQVDGRQATLDQLKAGEDVRASFNLSGRRPIALEVNAMISGSGSSSGSGTGSSGSSSGFGSGSSSSGASGSSSQGSSSPSDSSSSPSQSGSSGTGSSGTPPQR
jgi:hypothetical protein